METEVSKAFAQLPNIGMTLARELEQSGIQSIDALVEMGSNTAALAIEAHGFDICSSKLVALEGAIQGMRWHELPEELRTRRWQAFQGPEGNAG